MIIFTRIIKLYLFKILCLLTKVTSINKKHRYYEKIAKLQSKKLRYLHRYENTNIFRNAEKYRAPRLLRSR